MANTHTGRTGEYSAWLACSAGLYPNNISWDTQKKDATPANEESVLFVYMKLKERLLMAFCLESRQFAYKTINLGHEGRNLVLLSCSLLVGLEDFLFQVRTAAASVKLFFFKLLFLKKIFLSSKKNLFFSEVRF